MPRRADTRNWKFHVLFDERARAWTRAPRNLLYTFIRAKGITRRTLPRGSIANLVVRARARALVRVPSPAGLAIRRFIYARHEPRGRKVRARRRAELQREFQGSRDYANCWVCRLAIGCLYCYWKMVILARLEMNVSMLFYRLQV